MPSPRITRRRALATVLAAAIPSAGMPAFAAGGCCPDLSGDWSGSWKSATTGHSGRLCATLTRCRTGHYKCTFCGTFFKLIPFRYTVTLHVTGCENGRVRFRASRKLPLCGGTFSCRGSATACSFHATFSSQDDRGVFTLTR